MTDITAASSSSSSTSSSSYKEKVEKVVKFYSPPLPVICESAFVRHVEEVGEGASLLCVLESLLECQLELLTTWCLSTEVQAMFRGESRHLKRATTKWCDHAKAGRLERQGVKCLVSFIRSYPSRKLVVCAMEGSVSTNDLMVPGRILITPDGPAGFKIAFVSEVYSSENTVMDGYRKIFSHKPPFQVVCEKEFITYLQQHGLNSNDALEFLLGGEVNVLCILSAGPYMRKFVKDYHSQNLVVCTVEDGSYYAIMTGRVVVIPHVNGTIKIHTIATESMHDHGIWVKTVHEETHQYLYEKIRRFLLVDRFYNHSSRTKRLEKPMRLRLATTQGEETEFTYPLEVCRQMVRLAEMERSQSSEADDEELDVKFELFSDKEDDYLYGIPSVKITLEKLRIPRSFPDFTGASTSAQLDTELPEIAVDAAKETATLIADHSNSKELLKVIHKQLHALGLSASASLLLKEAGMTPLHSPAAPSSLANETACPVSSSIQFQWPSGRSSCEFLAVKNHKQEESSPKHAGVQSNMTSYFQEKPSPSLLKHKWTESRDFGGSHPSKRLNTSEQGFGSPTCNKEYAIEGYDHEEAKMSFGAAEQEENEYAIEGNDHGEAKMPFGAAEQEENEYAIEGNDHGEAKMSSGV